MENLLKGGKLKSSHFRNLRTDEEFVKLGVNDLKSFGACRRAGSIPAPGTILQSMVFLVQDALESFFPPWPVIPPPPTKSRRHGIWKVLSCC